MVAFFDNFEDVSSKFVGTICYYDDKPVVVKAVGIIPEKEKEFNLALTLTNGRGKTIELKDPLFRYRDYNIGYANHSSGAVWWFRKPLRQYRQGLKKDQLAYRVAIGGAEPEEHFNFSKPFCNMLTSVYPDIEECKKHLIDDHVTSLAFHRDFGISWDNIHEDFILEYRGQKIGNGVGRLSSQFRVIPEFHHVGEALKEAIG